MEINQSTGPERGHRPEKVEKEIKITNSDEGSPIGEGKSWEREKERIPENKKDEKGKGSVELTSRDTCQQGEDWRHFFATTPLEEIHNKTKISILSLQLFKKGEFTQMNRVRFYGFVRLLKSYYPEINFEGLVEEYKRANPPKEEIPVVTEELPETPEPTPTQIPRWIIMVGIIGVLVGGYFLFTSNGEKEETFQAQKEKVKVVKLDYNISQYVPPPTISTNTTIGKEGNISETNQTEIEEKGSDANSTDLNGEQNKKSLSLSTPVRLTPTGRVWLFIKNLETGKVLINRTVGPSEELELNGTKYFIKTGNHQLEIVINGQRFGLSKQGVNKILIEGKNVVINGKDLTGITDQSQTTSGEKSRKIITDQSNKEENFNNKRENRKGKSSSLKEKNWEKSREVKNNGN